MAFDSFVQWTAISFPILVGLTVTYIFRQTKLFNHPRIQALLQTRLPFYLITCFLQLVALLVCDALFQGPFVTLNTSVWLMTALLASFPFKTPISKILAFLAIASLAFFQVVGLLQPALDVLRNIHLKIGPNSLSLLALIKGITVTSLLIWVATSLSNYFDRKLKTRKHIQPSARLILSKLLKAFLVSFSIYIGFSLLGIDLAAFTFFAGAMGVGIAFGLQNILSNFFCGFILLMDRSIKPGDVVSIQDGKVYGVVNKLRARYVSIRTREGKEHLIPNQEIVSNKLENWSYSDTHVRMEIPFKVSFQSDLNLVETLLLEIAKDSPRVLQKPCPSIRFRSLTDNGVDLLLRFWISDPEHGFSDIQSHIIRTAWKAFQENGIRVPYPPREIYSQDSSALLSSLKNS